MIFASVCVCVCEIEYVLMSELDVSSFETGVGTLKRHLIVYKKLGYNK